MSHIGARKSLSQQELCQDHESECNWPYIHSLLNSKMTACLWPLEEYCCQSRYSLIALLGVYSCRICIAPNEISPCSSPEPPSSPVLTAPPKPKRSWATLDHVVQTASPPTSVESTDSDPSHVVNVSKGMLGMLCTDVVS